MRRLLFSVVACAGAAAVVTRERPLVEPCAVGAPVLFTNVHILTMNAPALIAGRSVLVERGRVAEIGVVRARAGDCVVDGHGGVLLPGLTDMHVHTEERELPLFLANGVTFIREMNGSPALTALRDRISRGDIVGPRMLVASMLLTATKLPYRNRFITSAADATAAAEEAKAAGYDYLKIYDGLTLAEYNAFVAAGKRLGLPLDGHIPADVGLARVVEAGQYIQHMDKIAFALSGHSADTSKFAELRKLFSGKREWVTPTLASLRALDMGNTVAYAQRLEGPEMAYVDSSSLGWWKSMSGTSAAKPPSNFFRYLVATLAALRQTDARFLLGTDAANPLMVAGFSVHDELDALVREGGFTPYDALLTSTRNVGEFLGDSTVGRIAIGARADFVLATANPVDSLATLRRPAGVMVAGRWLPRAALDSMLTSARLR